MHIQLPRQTYICTHISTSAESMRCIDRQTYMYMHTFTSADKCIHTYIYLGRIDVLLDKYIYTYIIYIYIYTYIYLGRNRCIHIYAHISTSAESMRCIDRQTYMYIHTCTSKDKCIYTYIYLGRVDAVHA